MSKCPKCGSNRNKFYKNKSKRCIDTSVCKVCNKKMYKAQQFNDLFGIIKSIVDEVDK